MSSESEKPLTDPMRGRSVFVSYKREDDAPPPENPSPDFGFVRYLSRQLNYELKQLGVPDEILWRDRAKIAPADDWSEVIRQELHRADLFLAVVSRNYIRSKWCKDEVLTMAQRIETLDTSVRDRRIFRVDKQRVLDEDIPEPLRNVHAVRFYDEDKERGSENYFFWRGRVLRQEEYLSSIHELAVAIYERLTQLGIAMQPQKRPTESVSKIQPNGRIVFVAKPASDLTAEYRSLVRELVERGYTVTPAPDRELPDFGEQVIDCIDQALSNAELSVHQIGRRRGFRPDGLQEGIVQLQLARAAKKALSIPTFQRLIWAPKMLPAEDAHEGSSLRDPLEVVEDFDHRLPSDQIDGSIAIKFSDFVLQRLAGIAFDAPADQRSVYLHFTLDDRNFSVNVARELKKVGFAPLLRPISPESTTEELAFAEGTLLSRVRTAIVCWGSATHAAIISELGNPALRKWKNIMPVHRKVTLFLGPPCCPPKTEMLEFGIGGDADVVVAGYAAEALSDAVKTDLVPRLNG